jgi:hypothetical protein
MIFLLFFLFSKPPDLLKLYKDGKYKELLEVFYQDLTVRREPRNIAILSLYYASSGIIDSAHKYYNEIPPERLDLLNLEGLSFKMGELCLTNNQENRAALAFYRSYLGGYRKEESAKYISRITGIEVAQLNDTVLNSLFKKRRLIVIVPISGEFQDAGNEFLNGFKMAYSGDFEVVDEENLDSTYVLPSDAIVVGPLRGANVRLLEKNYKFPNIWISAYSNYVPQGVKFFYSPYRSLNAEISFLVSYIVDSLMERKIALIRDTSWIDEIFSENFKKFMKERGRRISEEFLLENPLNYQLDSTQIDTEAISIFVISGLSPNSYPAYSIFKRNFPSKLFLGTSGWLYRVFSLPSYMLYIKVTGPKITLQDLIKAKDERNKFENDFVKIYGYYPSDLANMAYDAGKILSLIDDENLCGVLLNLKKESWIFSSVGAIWNLSGEFKILNIKEGNVLIEEERYDGEENTEER